MSSILCQAWRNAFRGGHSLVRLRLRNIIPPSDANLFTPPHRVTLFMCNRARLADGEMGVWS